MAERVTHSAHVQPFLRSVPRNGDQTFVILYRCGYTGHFLTWRIALLPRETAFSSVTDVSRSKFPVLNIHGYVKKITRSVHDI